MNKTHSNENMDMLWYRIMAYSTYNGIGTYCAVHPDTKLIEVYKKVAKKLNMEVGPNQRLIFNSKTRISDDPYDSVKLLELTQEGQILEITICDAEEFIK